MYTDDDILGPSLDLRVVKLYIECSLYIAAPMINDHFIVFVLKYAVLQNNFYALMCPK